MFFIPGFLISWVTFPGVMVHEAAHQLFCRLFRIPVFEVQYFRFKHSGSAGYVIHEATDKPLANFLICFGPFLLNTVFGALISMTAVVRITRLDQITFSSVLLGWLGLSLLMNAFPSTGDAKSLYRSVVKNPSVNLFAKILAFPLIGLIYLGAIGSVVWLDAVYGMVVAALIPRLLLQFLL